MANSRLLLIKVKPIMCAIAVSHAVSRTCSAVRSSDLRTRRPLIGQVFA